MIAEKAINPAVKSIAELPFYTEGPAMDSKGNIFCTTLTGGTILKIDSNENISEWARSLCPNGQIILDNDDHLVCDSKLGVIKRFDSEGHFIKNETENICEGEKVYSPNDLVRDLKGNIYFTDSIREKGKVLCMGADGRMVIIAKDLDYPNGIAISMRRKCLYVAESYKNRILKIDLKSDGTAANEIRVFAELPSHPSGRIVDSLPDGLALDDQGNLWVAHYGMHTVQILSPYGKLISFVNTTIPLTSNLFFTSPRTILVTGGYQEPGPGAIVNIHL